MRQTLILLGASVMKKQHLIEEIRRNNPTAEPGFLQQFTEAQLEPYLNRLKHVSGRRGRGSVWIRTDETTAVVTRAA